MFNKIIIKHFYINKMICLHKNVISTNFSDIWWHIYVFIETFISFFIYFGVFVFIGISLEGLFYHTADKWCSM